MVYGWCVTLNGVLPTSIKESGRNSGAVRVASGHPTGSDVPQASGELVGEGNSVRERFEALASASGQWPMWPLREETANAVW